MTLTLIQLILAAAATLAVNAIVFYLLIRSAVNAGAETEKRLTHAWAQTELLVMMARKQGVDDAALKLVTDRLR